MDIKTIDHFPRHRSQLQNAQLSLQHLKGSSPTPSTRGVSSSLDIHSTSPAASSSSTSQPAAISAIMSMNKFRLERRKHQLQRYLVAAPAENLYPLSDPAHKKGKSVRVSYGIKPHSVGWSGVMTSDLMTLDMARIAQTRTGIKVAKPNVTMEKETNVEFAAIVENNGFFNQECGAQHGIWGLGYRSLSVDRKPTLFDTLSATMKIPNGFALQLCGRKPNTTKTGNMFLGGYSSTHLAEPMQFVPLIKKDWYQVQLDGFKVMGDPVLGMQNINMPKTIVDSGTTNILMSHYNLQFLIRSLAQSEVVRWSSLIPEQDISNFWFRNAVLRLPRSSFQVSTAARAVEVLLSGVSIPIYTSSFLRIKSVPAGQAPPGYVDFWWHGFASSTSPDAIEAEQASGGAVTSGSVGTILGETLFAGKVVFFDRGVDGTKPGDPDYGRIGFARGRNCFASADHTSVNILANEGKAVDLEGLRPVRVVPTSGASTISGSSDGDMDDAGKTQPPGSSPPSHGFSGPIQLMGSASNPFKSHSLVYRVVGGLAVAIIAGI
ncbi:Beta-site APP-cleaving enzyme [Haplosporangium sp. Z 11]|nr:Beta-site APP-cleaving enzyme [Haplosporangium sp. Z 11]